MENITNTFFTVGPSQMYPTVQKHITQAFNNNIPSISHRSQAFSDIYKNTSSALRTLLNIPQSHHIYFLGSATEAMERVIQNTVENYSFHFVNGIFSKRSYTIAQQLGKQPQITEEPIDKGFDIQTIQIPKQTELINITHNETSGGTQFPLQDIYALKTKNPTALIAIDIVSSVPYVNLDFKKVDIAFLSIQKGFGLPAGLGVLIVNDQTLNKAETLLKKGVSIGSFHNLLTLADKEQKFQTYETPNVLAIYLLGKISEDMLSKGISVIRQETEQKAKLVYDFFDKHPFLNPLIKQKKYRSQTTICIDTKGETSKYLPLLAKKGFILSSGYGQYKDQQIRIANFPSISIDQIQKLLTAFSATSH